jgi:hypothetical protein
MVERGRPQMIVRRMRIACWIPKATHACARTHVHTHSEYVIVIAFLQQRWLLEHASVLRYTLRYVILTLPGLITQI